MSLTSYPTGTIITLDRLYAIEIGIIASMLKSEESFKKITASLTSDDFTFQNNAYIVDNLLGHTYQDIALRLSNNELKYAFAQSFLGAVPFLDVNVFYIPLVAEPSKDLDIDLQELLHYSNEKDKAMELNKRSDEKCTLTFTIVSTSGICTAIYIQNRLCKFHISNSCYIPDTFFDTFSLTLERSMPLINASEANEAFLKRCSEEPSGEGTLIIKIDTEALKKIGWYDLF